jgi:hypothetical protein
VLSHEGEICSVLILREVHARGLGLIVQVSCRRRCGGLGQQV